MNILNKTMFHPPISAIYTCIYTYNVQKYIHVYTSITCHSNSPPLPPGVSYAELRYEVPALGGSSKPERMDTGGGNSAPNHAPNSGDQSNMSTMQGGTIFSVTGNSRAPLHRVPSEYDVPPLPAPRGRNTPTLDSRDRLRENQDINKENSYDSINEDHVEELTKKGYNRMKVLEALRVAKNNITMAEEILETFVKTM
ncbi:hypothetical protein MAR_020433 [Mya arenaria]|uniref:UBA domain-containing protein n=1 Tax=Mya arenaria TaxID=6604 RepID=A0ABY7E7C8_MYAAR|nr:hypothetical protein MAR_020433 [Mya arenaria]